MKNVGFLTRASISIVGKWRSENNTDIAQEYNKDSRWCFVEILNFDLVGEITDQKSKFGAKKCQNVLQRPLSQR